MPAPSRLMPAVASRKAISTPLASVLPPSLAAAGVGLGVLAPLTLGASGDVGFDSSSAFLGSTMMSDLLGSPSNCSAGPSTLDHVCPRRRQAQEASKLLR